MWWESLFCTSCPSHRDVNTAIARCHTCGYMSATFGLHQEEELLTFCILARATFIATRGPAHQTTGSSVALQTPPTSSYFKTFELHLKLSFKEARKLLALFLLWRATHSEKYFIYFKRLYTDRMPPHSSSIKLIVEFYSTLCSVNSEAWWHCG